MQNESKALRDLDTLRKEIDEVDTALVALLNRRMGISKEVALYKKANGLPVYQPQREAALLEKVGAAAQEKEAVLAVYAAILAQSRALQG
ncbi:chorismate mutase [Ruminococcaceae bacterium OttesenSCG-928-N02]|nr:chorismate mutase [Ruminococcaceae bacterium OttesenSCG-928-N02]